jgi:glutaryl-CoA dehydrogenase
MMLGTALVTDHFLVREQFDEAEWEPFIRTRRFVDEEVLPVINDYWERAEFPWPLARRLAELELLDEGMSPLALGLVHMELNRGDGSLGTFFGVQTGLAMKAIEMLGSPEQQARWLGPMARLDAIGAFALTEPDHGSDSVALETSARREGDTWVLNGAKRWIGNGTIADVAVVWARSTEDGQVKGFLVETGTPGYHATVITGKAAARAVWQADIRLDDVRVSDTIAGLAKFNNTRKARQVIAEARDLLGGNGILLENHVIRHMSDIEVLHTFEGTETMQALIVGRDITGIGAFA